MKKESLNSNVSKLKKISQKFLEAIVKSVELIPVEIKKVRSQTIKIKNKK